MVEFLTTKELAALLRIKEHTVYDLVKEGSIPLSRVTGKMKRWHFLITASPIPVRGGTGSPLNPIATF